MVSGNASEAVLRGTQVLALLLLLALSALCLTWELWFAPTGSGTLALKVLPLLFCIPGLLKRRLYTFRWLALLLWLYVLEGLVRATSESGLGWQLAAAEVLLSVALFAACTAHIRKRTKKFKPMESAG